jgi:hypothetical protein
MRLYRRSRRQVGDQSKWGFVMIDQCEWVKEIEAAARKYDMRELTEEEAVKVFARLGYDTEEAIEILKTKVRL